MAKKIQTAYFCSECGAEQVKWLGQCPACGTWGSLVEERIPANSAGGKSSGGGPRESWAQLSQPKTIADIEAVGERRLQTPDAELNRVLGGEGIVLGSAILLAGDPGIGKSTLLLQLALRCAGLKVLYVSGEESEAQIKMRAARIPAENDRLYVAAETRLERVLDFFKDLKPQMLVVDSIQTLYSENLESAPGTVSQVRECTARLLRLAKETHTPLFLVGHITKEGMIAGPKVLEHMVDTVVSFEGDRHNSYRIIRTTKNRFGST
ncbi:MAG: DNA repair protein RadA, partial [Bacteroidetes bacterium]